MAELSREERGRVMGAGTEPQRPSQPWTLPRRMPGALLQLDTCILDSSGCSDWLDLCSDGSVLILMDRAAGTGLCLLCSSS